MACTKLKTDVPAGYLLWDKVEVTMSDLRECAVVDNIFPRESRKLGLIERRALAAWKPDRPTGWYDRIVAGQTFGETAPFMLRRSVSEEYPALWYIEDGSGRAIAFVANQALFDPSQTLAIGYLGREPDQSSAIVKEKFPQLLSA
jgi:hypothetical protein